MTKANPVGLKQGLHNQLSPDPTPFNPFNFDSELSNETLAFRWHNESLLKDSDKDNTLLDKCLYPYMK